MNWYRIEGNWKQAKGIIKQQWGNLIHDRLNIVSGKREQLVGKIQECYGITRDDAERRVKAWEAQGFDCGNRAKRAGEHAGVARASRTRHFPFFT